MASELGNPAALEDGDLIRLADRRQPVGDRQRRAAFRELVERGLDGSLGLGVEGARRLVEDQDRRVAQDRARDRDSLLLAAGEAVAALADKRVVTVRKGGDQVVDLRGARRPARSPASLAPGLANRRLSAIEAWNR